MNKPAGRNSVKPPLAARNYMAEFDETEAEFKDYVLRQKAAFASVPSKQGTDISDWLAFKIGCDKKQAADVLTWAEAA